MAAIQVYALFPRQVQPDSQLYLEPFNWHWIYCLKFPLADLNSLQFSPRPFKWLRYATSVVVGARGNLSTSPDALNLVDYDAGLPSESISLYYHTDDDEKRRMFSADPGLVRTHITSSVSSIQRDHFRENVLRRDGSSCVLNGWGADLCEAVHLIAHSKDDAYIATYSKSHSREPAGDDIIESIDDVRNGLLLNRLVHPLLGKGFAFLMTPNFAMNTDDVDPTAPPLERRYTAQLFIDRPEREFILGNGKLRIFDGPQWPPAIIFDAVYAGAVLHHFGAPGVQDEIDKSWKSILYPWGVATPDPKIAVAQKKQKDAYERQACRDARSAPDVFDLLLALPYIGVPPDRLEDTIRNLKESAQAKEQARVHEKVNAWMEKTA
ncbi:hypothetical protein BDN70DRAFT_995893 [Pholiota conissans]|uniref:HNH nuclease domain-containing protein n=1 Tax=Pholiota conissans TaxID=109636 RepID=A0A9P5YYD4_9AGAR|nr:hypothetical protein BDN70DRAFT_995893 [Pholiota conissans]